MDRITEIYSRIRPCKIFADIGCDHGFVSELVARHALAEKIYITDISAKCLAKAERLLRPYIAAGTVESAAGDGFAPLEERADEALIAGMGGEEIVKILSSAGYAPSRLILQPMKNTEKVRVFLVRNGYKLIEDVTFRDIKFYDLIVAEPGSDELTEAEARFGRTNLEERPEAFLQKLESDLADLEEYLRAPMSESARAELEQRRERIRELL